MSTKRRRGDTVAIGDPEIPDTFAPNLNFLGNPMVNQLVQHAEMASAYDRALDLYQALMQYMLVFNSMYVMQNLKPAILEGLAPRLARALQLDPADFPSTRSLFQHLGRQISLLNESLVNVRCAAGGAGGKQGDGDAIGCTPPLMISASECKTFDDIVGQSEAKLRLRDGFILPLKYPKLYAGITRGVLLYGPPGTGKTDIVRAALNSLMQDKGVQVVFYAPTGAELKGKYVGESEAKIKALFKCAAERACDCNFDYRVGDQILHESMLFRVARMDKTHLHLQSVEESNPNPNNALVPVARNTLKPPDECDVDPTKCNRASNMHYQSTTTVLSVIFIDEVDSVALDRNSKESSSTSALSLLALLQALDGMGTAPNVAVIAATNAPHKLDSAFHRRLPVKIHMGLPSAEELITYINLAITKSVIKKLTGASTQREIMRYCAKAVAERAGAGKAPSDAGSTCFPSVCAPSGLSPLLWQEAYPFLFPSKSVTQETIKKWAKQMVDKSYSFAEAEQVMRLVFGNAAARALKRMVFIKTPVTMHTGERVFAWMPPTKRTKDVIGLIRQQDAFIVPDAVPLSQTLALIIAGRDFIRQEIVTDYDGEQIFHVPHDNMNEIFVAPDTDTGRSGHYVMRRQGSLTQKDVPPSNFIPNTQAFTELAKATRRAVPNPPATNTDLRLYANELFMGMLQRQPISSLTYTALIGLLANGLPVTDYLWNIIEAVLASVWIENVTVHPYYYIFAEQSFMTSFTARGTSHTFYTDWGVRPGHVYPVKSAESTQFSSDKSVFSTLPNQSTLQLTALDATMTMAHYNFSVDAMQRASMEQKLVCFDINGVDFIDAFAAVPRNNTPDDLKEIENFRKGRG